MCAQPLLKGISCNQFTARARGQKENQHGDAGQDICFYFWRRSLSLTRGGCSQTEINITRGPKSPYPPTPHPLSAAHARTLRRHFDPVAELISRAASQENDLQRHPQSFPLSGGRRVGGGGVRCALWVILATNASTSTRRSCHLIEANVATKVWPHAGKLQLVVYWWQARRQMGNSWCVITATSHSEPSLSLYSLLLLIEKKSKLSIQ
jgi:hypothetical protein